MTSPPPVEAFLEASGLRHHIIEWPGDGKTVVLCHGFLDFAWSWRDVAERIQSAGFRVVALDWRGHGESDWVGAGGYYHFPDYVRDLSELIPQLQRSPNERLHLVGHSMGGTACSLYASTSFRQLESLVLLEGWGIEGASPKDTPNRLSRWLNSLVPLGADPQARALAENAKGHRLASLEDAEKRLLAVHPGLSQTTAAHLASKGTQQIDGGYRWRFDPLHRTPAPTPFWEEAYTACLRAIETHVFTVTGEHGLHIPDAEKRLSQIPHRRRGEVAEAGHMMHWTHPAALASMLCNWFNGRNP